MRSTLVLACESQPTLFAFSRYKLNKHFTQIPTSFRLGTNTKITDSTVEEVEVMDEEDADTIEAVVEDEAGLVVVPTSR